jgi:5'-3' exoribonuclease 1
LGINLGDIETIVLARPLMGMRYVYMGEQKMFLQKEWSEKAIPIAYQVTITDISIRQFQNEVKTIKDIFKPKSVCFMLGHPHYGSMGEVCMNFLIML